MFQRKIQCLIPKAVTPFQKAICVGAGVVSIGITGVTSFYVINNWRNYMVKRGINKEKDLTEEEKNRRYDKKTIITSATVGIVGGSFMVIGGINILYPEIKNYIKKIRGTTECCHIIRTTIFNCIKLPFFGIPTCLGLGIVVLSIDYAQNQYKCYQNRYYGDK